MRLPSSIRNLLTRAPRAPEDSLLPGQDPPPLQHRPYTYVADGLATIHYSPCLDDEEFTRIYPGVLARWFPDGPHDPRWRAWIVTRLARYVVGAKGASAEFGVYRAGFTELMLRCGGLTRPLHLFDTFEGIPDAEYLTDGERADAFGGLWADTSVEYVASVLDDWRDDLRFHVGDVFETLKEVETGPLAFAQIDLNAAAPTIVALEYVLERLIPGGVLVLDDYGAHEYRDQRFAIEAAMQGRREVIQALPTGQGIVLGPPAG